jgi:phage-related minor tail protein
MEQYQIFKQMAQFNKNAFDNGYRAMETLRKQNEKMANSIIEQVTWLPEEGKRAINEWMQLYNKGCDDFKKTVDQNYKNVEDFFTGFGK